MCNNNINANQIIDIMLFLPVVSTNWHSHKPIATCNNNDNY